MGFINISNIYEVKNTRSNETGNATKGSFSLSKAENFLDRI
jgi:hypothetical protein